MLKCLYLAVLNLANHWYQVFLQAAAEKENQNGYEWLQEYSSVLQKR